VGFAVRLFAMISLPAAMLFVLFSPEVIRVVYGALTFDEAIPVLAIFGLVIFVRFAVETFGLVLTTTRRQHSRMWIVVGGAAVNVALNSVAIPRYGIVGAAWVSLIANLVVGIAYIVMAKGAGISISEVVTRRALIVVGCIVALGGVIAMVPRLPFWSGAAISLVGVPAIVLLWGFTRREREFLLLWRTTSGR
jgi:O-antigen/teichoic acid export membrane protein